MSDNLIINEFKEILDEQSLQKLEHFLDEDNASFCDAQNEINGHEQVAYGLKLDTKIKKQQNSSRFCHWNLNLKQKVKK